MYGFDSVNIGTVPVTDVILGEDYGSNNTASAVLAHSVCMEIG
ncbi:hypothetical protein [Anaplasma phagocytophilum]|nr:hypothetical protein [Anaplasma phagocytophilum]